MLTALLATGFVGLFFVMMAVKLIFKKNGEFSGTCASQSPFLNKEGVTCSVCGNDPTKCESNNEDKLEPLPTIA